MAQVILDLTNRGHGVFLPAFSEHFRYDLIADAVGRLLKVQCKFRMGAEDGQVVTVPASTSWSNASGTHTVPYEAGDFDCYAIWAPAIGRVLYVPWMGQSVSIALRPRAHKDYFWWEDFLEFPPKAPVKRQRAQPGTRGERRSRSRRTPRMPAPAAEKPKTHKPRVPQPQKIVWPSRDDLAVMVWQLPTSRLAKQLGVSDKAVEKRCQKLGIDKPSRGYWARNNPAAMRDNDEVVPSSTQQ